MRNSSARASRGTPTGHGFLRPGRAASAGKWWPFELGSRSAQTKEFMDEKPKSIWKKTLGRSSFGSSLLMAMVGATIIAGIGVACGLANDAYKFAIAWVALVLILWLLVEVIRWLCCWRNLKISLFGLACLFTVIALFYAEEDWRGWHAWNQFKKEWEAKGEHFDFASVIPPPVPDNQKFALTPVVASSYEYCFDKKGHEVMPRNTNVVDRLSMITWRDNHWTHQPKSENWQTAQRTDLKAWQEFFRSPPPTNSVETNSYPIAPQPQTPVADILLALSKYDSAIAEIRAASQLPYARFPLTYDKAAPFNILLPHLAAAKSCAQTVSLRALAELQSGQTKKAEEDVKLSLYLAGSLRAEPFLISQLVRLAMVQVTLQPVYEGLAEHQWSDAQLVALEVELTKLDLLADYKLSMRGEMGCHDGAIGFMVRNRREIFNLVDSNNNNTPPPFLGLLIPSGWFYQNQFRCDRIIVEQYIPLADMNMKTISPAAVRHADEVLRAETKKTTPFNIFEKMLMPAIGPAVKKFAHGQTSVNLARTAIALERYRLAHGEFPEALDALAPQFIAKVPHDVIGGQPLKYRRTNDRQFVLYSIGWNEKDDGGVTGHRNGGTAPNFESGDWVWRYPQK